MAFAAAEGSGTARAGAGRSSSSSTDRNSLSRAVWDPSAILSFSPSTLVMAPTNLLQAVLFLPGISTVFRKSLNRGLVKPYATSSSIFLSALRSNQRGIFWSLSNSPPLTLGSKRSAFFLSSLRALLTYT